MKPSAAVPPGLPFTCQNTGIGVLAEDVAVQAREFPEVTFKFAVCVESRQIIELMAVAALIWMVAVAVSVVWAWATAVIVTTLLGVGCVVGAVYKPFVSIVPKVALPPATGVPEPLLTSHVTRVLLRFRMFCVHCTVPFTTTEAAAQETVNEGAAGVEPEPPPHEARANRAGRSAKIRNRRCHCACFGHTEPLN